MLGVSVQRLGLRVRVQVKGKNIYNLAKRVTTREKRAFTLTLTLNLTLTPTPTLSLTLA